ncbi:MAG: DUF1015 domain-containing protein [candidate division NC10 bacterium]|nr:DUF1015 domain-containing protein [candidate division NC10 bacterium]
MAVIRPFRGLRYHPGKVVDLASVMSLPYDVLTERDREELLQANPYNIVRLIWGKDLPGDGPQESKYLRASRLLHEWMQQGILTPDEQEAFYLSVQDFALGSEVRTRRGIIARVPLQGREAGEILRHEETFSEQKEDRLRLLQATHANLDPIFGLYEGSGPQLEAIMDEEMKRPPLLDLRDRWGVRQRLWAITDSNAHQRIEREMEDRRLFIADGHHRYEAALEYYRQMGEYDQIMMVLISMEDPGLVILPVHRLLREMGRDVLGKLLQTARAQFSVAELRLPPSEKEKAAFVQEQLRKNEASAYRCGVYGGGDSLFLLSSSKPDAHLRLDVEVLDEVILHGFLGLKGREKEEKVSYTSDTGEALREVEAGSHDLAFLVRPTSLGEVRSISLAGKRMPPKSTYFYPKLLSGLVINRLGT